MTKLSVNVNKFATIRNARGGNNPDLSKVVMDCERFGAQGITVHPRPDERHITHRDVIEITNICKTEFNIEGYPDQRLLDLIAQAQPAQATFVPDPPEAITSNAGWDTLKNQNLLENTIRAVKEMGVRVSLFVDPEISQIEGAKQLGADRVELYTEPYAKQYHDDKELAVKAYREASLFAKNIGLGVNAGHDLDLDNLNYLHTQLPTLDEVSIGHALVCDALYLGLENTIQMYLRQLKSSPNN